MTKISNIVKSSLLFTPNLDDIHNTTNKIIITSTKTISNIIFIILTLIISYLTPTFFYYGII